MWVAVGLLTVLAAVARLPGYGESLFADELFTYDAIYGHGLADVVRRVTTGGGENTPPLYFVFAWASAKLGDPTVLIRLPSLLLGTALVPLVYLLGQRMVGRVTGLVAAALTAASPQAVYFSTEARPYATLMFLIALSTLMLLVAIEKRRPIWWIIFSLASIAALYTHYTALPVLLVQGAWALWAHREADRPIVVSHLVIAASVVPWIPLLAAQGGTQNLAFIEAVFPLSFGSFARFTARLVPGYEGMGISEVPGWFAMWILIAAVAIALIGAVVRLAGRGSKILAERPPKGLVLAVGLALATPVAILLYSLVGWDIYIPRHLLASFPALMIVLAWLFTSLPRPLAGVTTLLALSALTVGVVRAHDPDRNRPPLKQAARYIDARADPGDPIVEYVFLSSQGLFTRHLEINLKRSHTLYQWGFVPTSGDFWKSVEAARRIFVVEPWGDQGDRSPLPAGLERRFRLSELRVWRGRPPVAVLEFVRRSGESALRRRRAGGVDGF